MSVFFRSHFAAAVAAAVAIAIYFPIYLRFRLQVHPKCSEKWNVDVKQIRVNYTVLYCTVLHTDIAHWRKITP